MMDCIMDGLIDTLKLLPYLLVTFLVLEFIEHKLSKKNQKVLEKNKKLGPLLGGLLGALPQCGFSSMAANLFSARVITMGTLIAVFLSTSDEMLPILLSQNVSILLIFKILLIKVFIGMTSGFIIDFILRKKDSGTIDYKICHEENCHCKDHLLLSVIKHTLHITLFLIVTTFFLNLLVEYTGILDTNNIIANNPFSILVTSLIGLIPNCGASVMITTLYVKEVISFAALISGLLTGSGVALLVLFRANKKLSENMLILSLIYSIGVITGLVIELVSYIC